MHPATWKNQNFYDFNKTKINIDQTEIKGKILRAFLVKAELEGRINPVG